MEFVRLQHEEGLSESSSQQNSAPGQATIGSHSDGNTVVGLAVKDFQEEMKALKS